MAMTIYKYPLTVEDVQKVKLPTRHRLLKVHAQNDVPTLWALVDPEFPDTEIEIRIIGTGWELPREVADWDYLGTVHTPPFVWHIFKV